jgi:hypothetical protein
MYNKKLYINKHTPFIDRIIYLNRIKIVKIIHNYLKDEKLNSILDVGTTNDKNKSSNILIKKLKFFNEYKSISNQRITDNFFKKKITKSITENLSKKEIQNLKSDVVLSNATIEHTGSTKKQIKMCENIIKLSKKYFIIITPNRLHPLEFHTKIPLIHWMPKKLHRKILNFFKFDFLSKEQNLNLLTKNDLIDFMEKLRHKKYFLFHIRFLLFKSNIILIGKKN